MVLPGHEDRQDAPRAIGEGVTLAETLRASLRRCRACGESKPPEAFECGRGECRTCGAARKRREYRRRRDARAEAERVAAGVTAERIARRIAARPAQVAALLDDEERRGRC